LGAALIVFYVVPYNDALAQQDARSISGESVVRNDR